MWKIPTVKKIFFDLIFPPFCFGCQKEGNYLCEDCKACLDIYQHQYCLCENPIKIPRIGKCSRCKTKKLDGLCAAVSYQKALVKKIIQNFKYEPFIKELSTSLSSLIISHFQLLDNNIAFDNCFLVPVPLEKRRLKWRGFNQAEEIAKGLADYLKIPLINDCLIKIKETPPQMELSSEERKENIKGVFLVKDKEVIRNKKILLVDDVYTTGSTMEECARVLKESGAKEVIGIVVARE